MKKYILLALCGLTILVGCGKKSPNPNGSGSDENPSPPTHGNSGIPVPTITYDSTVSSEHKELLQGDFATLTDLNFPDATPDDLARMGTTDLSGQTLTTFISDRIKYIVGEDYDDTTLKTSTTLSSGYTPILFSSVEQEFSKVVTVMSNLGSATYRDGKKYKLLYSLPIADNSVVIKSPRVGIIKIGEGLFSANKVASSKSDSLVNRLMRLGTLFHEARHDDGNGTNVGFPHKKCDTGTFAGYYACESNTNGPYNLEAMLLKKFYQACSNCTETEKSGLQLAAADSASRLASDAISRDPHPEKIQ